MGRAILAFGIVPGYVPTPPAARISCLPLAANDSTGTSTGPAGLPSLLDASGGHGGYPRVRSGDCGRGVGCAMSAAEYAAFVSGRNDTAIVFENANLEGQPWVFDETRGQTLACKPVVEEEPLLASQPATTAENGIKLLGIGLCVLLMGTISVAV